MGWQPISTYPKKAGEVLLYFPPTGSLPTVRGPVLCARIAIGHPSGASRKPTHWMPLPPPPEAE